ncbi:MAG: hypothetical protein IKQ39_02095 [Oscillospiraceae bacterium]|nr:hypothetical protein [Oscillospiraceae bacterium]
MRQTNEEFMAEVMRRSAAYRVRRRKQITGTAAALCMAAVVGFGAFALRTRSADRMNTADNAVSSQAAAPADNSSAADAAMAEEVNSEAEYCREEAAESASYADAAEDNLKDDDTDAPEYEGNTVFSEMTDEALCDYYGIAGLPSFLSGRVLKPDRTIEEHTFWILKGPEQNVHGITRMSDGANGTIVDDRNTWIYREEETGYTIYVTLSREGLYQYTADENAELYSVAERVRDFYFVVEGHFPDEEELVGKCAAGLNFYWN